MRRGIFSGGSYILAGMLLTAVFPLHAEDWPCAEDARSFCTGVSVGGGRLADCLKENHDKLSQACQEHLGLLRQRLQSFQDACGDDAKKLCADVEPGGGRIAKCLSESHAQLSTSCQDAMVRLKERYDERRSSRTMER